MVVARVNAKDPCTGIPVPRGDGCTASVGSGESEVTNPTGYCTGSTQECVSCNGGYAWDSECESCWEDCPVAVQDDQYSGCTDQSVTNAVRVSSTPGSCISTYACDNSVSPWKTCWQCNTGYHWDTTDNDCVSDCTIPTCETDCNTAALCVPPMPDDGPFLNDSCYWDGAHCCTDLSIWDGTKCEDFDPCFDAPAAPCAYDPGNPFGPTEPEWWDFVNNCISQIDACCYVEDFEGGYTYAYLTNQEY